MSDDPLLAALSKVVLPDETSPGRRRRASKYVKARVVALRRQGMYQQDIADALGIARQTVQAILYKRGDDSVLWKCGSDYPLRGGRMTKEMREEAVRLVREEKMSYEQVARIVGCSRGAVWYLDTKSPRISR